MRRHPLQEWIRELIREGGAREILRPALEKLAASIRADRRLISSPATIRQLAAFNDLLPGQVPTERDVDRELDKLSSAMERDLENAKWYASVIRNSPKEVLRFLKYEEERRRRNEKPEGETWGRHLFAAHRDDVPFEEDTPEEAKAYAAIRSFFYKNVPLPTDVTDELRQLIGNGEYHRFLVPNEKYAAFYRGLYGVTTEHLTEMLGRAPSSLRGKQTVDTVFSPRANGSAWSVKFNVAETYASDPDASLVSSAFSSTGPWSIVMKAERANNPDVFLFNPDELYEIGDFMGDQDGDFASSREVYAVGPVNVSRIFYWQRGRR